MIAPTNKHKGQKKNKVAGKVIKQVLGFRLEIHRVRVLYEVCPLRYTAPGIFIQLGLCLIRHIKSEIK